MNSAASALEPVTSADRPIEGPRSPEPESKRLVAVESADAANRGGRSSLGAVFLAWSEQAPDLVPSRRAFADLAADDPAKLAAWILTGTLGRGHLSHAAEILGQATRAMRPADGVILVLDRLLTHPSPAVREGAVYGLRYHLTPRVLRRLAQMQEDDPSDGVREAIEDVLED